MRPAEAAASPVGQWVPSPMDQYGLGGRSQVPSDRKWALGLQVCSKLLNLVSVIILFGTLGIL